MRHRPFHIPRTHAARNLTLAALLSAGLAVSNAPAMAQNDFEDVVSGLAQSLLAQELERGDFEAARSTNSVRGWQNYLNKYPKGVYRAQAQAALAKLQGVVNPPVVKPVDPVVPDVGVSTGPAGVEASLGLSREQRRLIQRQLTSLGYDTGTPDGLWGRGTRGAIATWQKANGYNPTGYVTAAEVTKIRQQAGKITTPEETTATNDLLEERLLGLTSAERREVQRMLTLLGYSTGGADGVFGGNTRRALAAWQRDEGERASGYITADQLRTLRSQTGG